MSRNIFKIFKTALPIFLLPYSLKTYESFSWRTKKPNVIKDRVYTEFQAFNNPCEDRNSKKQLTNINGYAIAVFDGHGGWQVSNYCQEVLLNILDEKIGENKSKIQDEVTLITTSLKEAFEAVESSFLHVAREGYKLGFGGMARAGSCALVCVVVDNKIYTANAGDSLGIVINEENKVKDYIEMNRELNANNKDERERLKSLFPNESDIIVCKKKNETSCYVKGRLQPTRSLGDLRLKHEEFNNPKNYSSDEDYQSIIETFTGPYILWEPEIQVLPLLKTDKSIVLASDGLWDLLKREEVVNLFKSKSVKEMPRILISYALFKASYNAGLSVKAMREIPEDKKLKYYDDITVIVVDLEGQYKE